MSMTTKIEMKNDYTIGYNDLPPLLVLASYNTMLQQ